MLRTIRHSMIFSLFILFALNTAAQEFDASVELNLNKLQVGDPKVFASLKQTVEEFMSNQKWTEDIYETEERIKLNILLALNDEVSTNNYNFTMTIQAVRPVYGTDYETALFTHVDKDVSVSYQEYQPVQYTEDVFLDNLSSTLSYYAYIILGLDADSFILNGGTDYFQRARIIQNTVPKNIGGWDETKKQNRFWIIENILNSRMRLFRQAFYNLHRNGLDLMSTKPDEGRKNILKSLQNIDRVNSNYLNSFLIQIFINTKSEELVEIFKGAPPAERQQFSALMIKIDPPGSNKYRF